MSRDNDDRSCEVKIVLDNDVIAKSVCYGIAPLLWSDDQFDRGIGVLGAARFVVRAAIKRHAHLRRATNDVIADLNAFLAMTAQIEPDPTEVAFAADIERAAQEHGVAVDTGESQLVAVTVTRAVRALHTGDKRAIAALEQLIDGVARLTDICGKVYMFEQLVLDLVGAYADFDRIAEFVCSEPGVDTAMSICFGCYSGVRAEKESTVQGLSSYINKLRVTAPRVLAA